MENPKFQTGLLLILLLCLVAQPGFSQMYDLRGVNDLRYGYNPVEDNIMNFGEFGPSPRRLPIFDFDDYQISDYDDDCLGLAYYVPADTDYDCYNDTYTESVEVSDLHSLGSFAYYDLEIDQCYEVNIWPRVGSMNTWVQNKFSNFVMSENPNWQVDMLYQQQIYLGDFEWNFNGKFIDAVFQLDPTPGQRYYQFIELYGIYIRYNTAYGGMFNIYRNAPDGFSPQLCEDDFYAVYMNHDYDSLEIIGGIPELMSVYGAYDGWAMSSYHRMGLMYQELRAITDILDDQTFYDLNSNVLTNLEDTINEYLGTKVGRLWLDPTIYQNEDPCKYVISVLYSSGLSLHADGPAYFYSEIDGDYIVDIAINSQFVDYLYIGHANSSDDFEGDGPFGQGYQYGRKSTLNNLSAVTSIYADDLQGQNSCAEIMFLINDQWYPGDCEPLLFPDGIFTFEIFDRSGW